MNPLVRAEGIIVIEEHVPDSLTKKELKVMVHSWTDDMAKSCRFRATFCHMISPLC